MVTKLLSARVSQNQSRNPNLPNPSYTYLTLFSLESNYPSFMGEETHKQRRLIFWTLKRAVEGKLFITL